MATSKSVFGNIDLKSDENRLSWFNRDSVWGGGEPRRKRPATRDFFENWDRGAFLVVDNKVGGGDFVGLGFVTRVGDF